MKTNLLLAAAVISSTAWAGPIQDAINAAPNNGVVEIPAGVYQESIKVKDGITLVGAGAETTIIDAQGADTAVLLARNSMMIGFTIRNARTAVRNENGSFVGVFECDILDFQNFGIRIESGSAALLHNRVMGDHRGVGIACFGSNPYVGYSLIQANRIGVQAVMEYIPTVDHCVFDDNETGIEVLNRAQLVSKNNIFSRNKTAIVGQNLGADDAEREVAPEDLALHRGNSVESYRALMSKVFEQAAAMHPRVIYDLSDTPGRFHLTISYPWASFTVLASTKDTIIEAYDAYDRSTDHELRAAYQSATGYPGITLDNPELQEKSLDRYVLEKIFNHVPSLNFTADGALVFDRLTNISRIEVVPPPGYHFVEAGPGGTISTNNGRESFTLTEIGFTRIHAVMSK